MPDCEGAAHHHKLADAGQRRHGRAAAVIYSLVCITGKGAGRPLLVQAQKKQVTAHRAQLQAAHMRPTAAPLRLRAQSCFLSC